MKNKTLVKITVAGILTFSSVSGADGIKSFLLDCAYGTAIGALFGVATVALSDKPSENGMNIARGASLGLYAGIGFGIYEINQSRNTQNVWFEPFIQKQEQHRIEGVKANWIISQF